MHRNVFNYLFIALKGIAMGAADVVPGVSGGTIAFITGIYEELIASIDNINLEILKLWKTAGFKAAWKAANGNFLLAVFLGIAVSILSLAKLIEWLLHNHPILLWAFFFGLVLASILYIAKQIQHWDVILCISIVVTAVLSYFITEIEPFTSPENPLYLIFCGFVAIIAMILPGISGAFILLILGAYQIAINTINDLREGLFQGNFEQFKDALINFILLGIGAIIGLKVFSKALNWMFKHQKNITLAILTGFMIGSLNKIWPWKKTMTTRINSEGMEVPLLEKSIRPSQYNGDNQLVLALVFMIIGVFVIFILERLGKQKQQHYAK